MKFLEHSGLADLEMKLSGLEVGDFVLDSKFEAYSCKLAMGDKELSKSLDRRFNEEMERSQRSPQYLSLSPVGPLTESTSRRTLLNLICTLNAAYPDYDFSTLTLDCLTREKSVESVVRRIDSNLEQVYKCLGQSLRTALWTAIDEVIAPNDCEIYSYVSDNEETPFDMEFEVWSTHLFFYNKRQKKVLLVSLSAYNRFALETIEEEEADDMEFEMDGMDDTFGSRTPALAY
uniref:Repressor of RNA polymerase III transcription n=1 Tax=Rhodosorus marinus TaxID=101924 RepID=A0A7S0BBV0_9RHOD|mmetsp:Transcript_10070/g.14526  ORF Transcript_10070/g.14526 Transcript_10070/m.14526 type:complete len:232 (+) Transcript_10070:271-966(+)